MINSKLLMPTKSPSAHAVDQAEVFIDQAVRKVYRAYGPDLFAFFEAVKLQRETDRLEKQQKEHSDRSVLILEHS